MEVHLFWILSMLAVELQMLGLLVVYNTNCTTGSVLELKTV